VVNTVKDIEDWFVMEMKFH